MSLFTTELNELVSNIEGMSFVVENINKVFATTPLFTQMLSAEVVGKKKIDLEKRERIFQSSSPVFVRRIEFFGEGFRNIELCFYTSEGVPKNISVESNAKSGWVVINDFCLKFSIRSKGMLSRPKISTVNIYGFEFTRIQKMRSALSEFASASYNLSGFVKESKDIVAALETKHEVLTEEVEEYSESVASLTIESGKLEVAIRQERKVLEGIEGDVESAKINLSSLTAEVQAKENNLQQLTRETKTLNDGVSDLKQELSSLVNDRSLISDEFSDYIKEGRGQAQVYLRLMVVPAFVIGMGVCVIYNGANNFLSTHYESTGDVMAAFLLRIPFAAVVGGAIYYSWKIAHAFMVKIFSIQEERLTLAKLLILAKNTVFSTAEDLGIDSVEKFHMRTRLKIEMLKSHLASNIGVRLNMPELEQSNKSNSAPTPTPTPTPTDEVFVR